MAAVRDQLGAATILINNAGISPFSRFLKISQEEFEQVFAVNVRGIFDLCQVVLPDMIAAGWGRIVNISSSSAQTGNAGQVHYSASKGALMTLTKNTATYLNRYRIRVNQLNVGWTDTPNEHRVKMQEEGKGTNWLEEATLTRPFGRLLLPRDIAYAALYFASDESECITGSVLDLEQYPVGAPPNV